jgi:hypothetical protein
MNPPELVWLATGIAALVLMVAGAREQHKAQ